MHSTINIIDKNETLKTNIKSITLPLYIHVTFKGSFNINPITPRCGIYEDTGVVDHRTNELNQWVPKLNYNHTPIKITGDEKIFSSWNYLDYETIYTIMKVNIYCYYSKRDIIEEQNYYIINSDGHVIKLLWDENDFSQVSNIHGVPVYDNMELQLQNDIIIIPYKKIKNFNCTI